MFLGNIIYDLHRFRDTYLSSLFFLKQNLIYCQNCFFLRQKSKGQKQFCKQRRPMEHEFSKVARF